MRILIEKYVEAWDTHDPKKLADLLASTSSYEDATQKGNALEIISSSIETTVKAFPDVSFEVISLIESSSDKELFVLEWLMQGTNRGTFYGAEPTNKTVSITGLDLIRTKDERITKIKSFYDSNQFMTQMKI
ncbi:ester cyclase [Fulvivirga sp. M361]|uniref:ester cyclase n=1 Tax=Fulvivirga sp. M361 TaxID=2594266 RepID=UPI00117B322E|nr:ester cyclase [Fulvivirga sp. M361]TRX62734.1 ester cyclase [Fulvivirga sp. M361]